MSKRKDQRRLHHARIDTMIGQTTEIQGNICFSGGLHIEGRVLGDICSKDNNESVLVIGRNGFVKGQIEVPYLLACGTIEGDLKSHQRMEFVEQAKVVGDVRYRHLQMASGARIEGRLIALDEEPPLLEHQQGTAEAATAKKNG